MIVTKVSTFGKRSPIAAFDFEVFDALEEPEVLLPVLPGLPVALVTCGDKEQSRRWRRGWGW
jgi:hypothetical protein